MTKNTGFGQGLEIAALKKNTGSEAIDLMRPGNGTPWEDRGSGGPVGAYFQTVLKSLTSPGLLLDHMRRPETTSDSTSFAVVSGAMWVASIFIYNAYWVCVVLPGGQTIYEKQVDSMYYYWLTTALYGVLIAGGLFAWVTVGPLVYRALGATELKRATPALIRNCFNYCLGPSIFALVPIYGSAVAGIWIVVNLIVAGRRRLYIKPSSAVVNVMIIAFITVVIGTVAFFLLQWIWGPNMLQMNGLTIREIPKAPVIPTRDN